jgi:hypothetical protein
LASQKALSLNLHLPLLIEGVTGALRECLTPKLPKVDLAKAAVWGAMFESPPGRKQPYKGILSSLSELISSHSVESTDSTAASASNWQPKKASQSGED